MTRNRARKKAIRARMAADGEPYSVAARKLAANVPTGGTGTVREIIVRATSTLAEASARIEFRVDFDVVVPEPRARRRPGLVARLARRAAKAAWTRLAPDVDVADLQEAFAHQVGVGFVEPVADRYLIDYGSYAVMRAGDKSFGGRSGSLLQARHRHRRARERSDDPLRLLRLVQDATDAQQVGDQTLRETLCRVVAVRPGPAEFTVWVDDQHIRKIQYQESASGNWASVSKKHAVELWDFGVPVGWLDWSRLPSFQSSG